MVPSQRAGNHPRRRSRVGYPAGTQRPRGADNPPPGELPALDSHLELGDLADVGGYRALGPDVARGEHAQRPRPGRGEEPEPAVLAERYLGHELTTRVEQASIAGRHR